MKLAQVCGRGVATVPPARPLRSHLPGVTFTPPARHPKGVLCSNVIDRRLLGGRQGRCKTLALPFCHLRGAQGEEETRLSCEDSLYGSDWHCSCSPLAAQRQQRLITTHRQCERRVLGDDVHERPEGVGVAGRRVRVGAPRDDAAVRLGCSGKALNTPAAAQQQHVSRRRAAL
jgi:hypothetical protein